MIRKIICIYDTFLKPFKKNAMNMKWLGQLWCNCRQFKSTVVYEKEPFLTVQEYPRVSFHLRAGHKKMSIKGKG